MQTSRADDILFDELELDNYTDDCYFVALTEWQVTVLLSVLRYAAWESRWVNVQTGFSTAAAKITLLERCLMSGCAVSDLVKTNLMLVSALTGEPIDLDAELPTGVYDPRGVVEAIDDITCGGGVIIAPSIDGGNAGGIIWYSIPGWEIGLEQTAGAPGGSAPDGCGSVDPAITDRLCLASNFIVSQLIDYIQGLEDGNIFDTSGLSYAGVAAYLASASEMVGLYLNYASASIGAFLNDLADFIFGGQSIDGPDLVTKIQLYRQEAACALFNSTSADNARDSFIASIGNLSTDEQALLYLLLNHNMINILWFSYLDSEDKLIGYTAIVECDCDGDTGIYDFSTGLHNWEINYSLSNYTPSYEDACCFKTTTGTPNVTPAIVIDQTVPHDVDTITVDAEDYQSAVAGQVVVYGADTYGGTYSQLATWALSGNREEVSRQISVTGKYIRVKMSCFASPWVKIHKIEYS